MEGMRRSNHDLILGQKLVEFPEKEASVLAVPVLVQTRLASLVPPGPVLSVRTNGSALWLLVDLMVIYERRWFW